MLLATRVASPKELGSVGDRARLPVVVRTAAAWSVLSLRGGPDGLAFAIAGGSRQVPLVAPIGVHEVDVGVAVSLADEGELPSVR